MQYLSPASDRNAITIWRGIDTRTGQPLRITRVIDIDGDEHWTSAIWRDGIWSRMPRLCGRNADTSKRLRERFGITLYEREELAPFEGDDFGGTRIRLDVEPCHPAADDGGPEIISAGRLFLDRWSNQR